MKNTRTAILHVIVAESPCAKPGIRYRRHRLAEYVSQHSTTAGVFWVYRDKGASGRRSTSETVSAGGVQIRSESPGDTVREFAIPTKRSLARFIGPLHRNQLARLAQSISSHPAARKVLWFTVPEYDGLLHAFAWDQVIYDCSDFWSGAESKRALKSRLHTWLKARLKARSEARIVRASDLVFASSVFLAARLDSTFGREAIVVENGVDMDRFRSAARPTEVKTELPARPRLAFVGPLKQLKIDFDLLRAVALAVPRYNLVLIGPAENPVPALERLLELPNVTWLGPRNPDEIPRLMNAMDVGLLPYRERRYNEGVFPLKFFEYLAADLPVVGCGLPSTSAYVEDGVYAHTEATAAAFVNACQAALRWERPLPKRMALASQNDWRPKLGRIHNNVIRSLGVIDVGVRNRSLL